MVISWRFSSFLEQPKTASVSSNDRKSIEEGCGIGFAQSNWYFISFPSSRALGNIRDQCMMCHQYAASQARFELTNKTQELKLNHCIQVDGTNIDGTPDIWMVDHETNFYTASFLQNYAIKGI